MNGHMFRLCREVKTVTVLSVSYYFSNYFKAKSNMCTNSAEYCAAKWSCAPLVVLNLRTVRVAHCSQRQCNSWLSGSMCVCDCLCLGARVSSMCTDCVIGLTVT